MADKPAGGFTGVIAASTALSDIDGQAGLLFRRACDYAAERGRTSMLLGRR
jgi:2-methylcitrate synthase